MTECPSNASQRPVELSSRGALRACFQGVRARLHQGVRGGQQLVRLVYLSRQYTDLFYVDAVAAEGHRSPGGRHRISHRALAKSFS